MSGVTPKRSKLVAFVSKNVDKICIVSYVLGVVGFLALPFREFSESQWHSENALLTGLQTSNYGNNDARIAKQYNTDFRKIGKDGRMSDIEDELVRIMKESGLSAYKQQFTIKSPLPEAQKGGSLQYQVTNGSNVYGFIRAGRAASTECIVINVPIFKDRHNYAIGLALSFGRKIRTQLFWAKDVVLLFTEMGYGGAQAWLQSYYDVKNSDFIQAEPLKERAGTILAALNLELPETFNFLSAEVVGNNGQLPNLDVFNVVRKLCALNDMVLGVAGVLNKHYYEMYPLESYLDSLKMTVKMMANQAKGFSDINHAVFLQHNVQSLTLQGRRSRSSIRMDIGNVGRVVEGFSRSMNNLLEKLHHSYFFYLISATDRFISIVLYMPTFGLILLPATLKALCLWLKIQQDHEKEEETASKKEEGDDDAIEDLIKQRRGEKPEEKAFKSAWTEIFYILAITHLLGVVLYYSPAFAPSWSAMYNLSPEESLILIFISTYCLALVLPFSSFIRFSEDPNVHEMLRVVALVFYSMILGCTAVMNFSLAMVMVVFSVPMVTPIRSHAKRLKFPFIVMALLSSPITIAIVASYANQYLFGNKMGNFWVSAKSILQNAYEQSLLGNSWNYELACLLLYPNWLLFWFLAVARKTET